MVGLSFKPAYILCKKKRKIAKKNTQKMLDFVIVSVNIKTRNSVKVATPKPTPRGRNKAKSDTQPSREKTTKIQGEMYEEIFAPPTSSPSATPDHSYFFSSSARGITGNRWKIILHHAFCGRRRGVITSTVALTSKNVKT